MSGSSSPATNSFRAIIELQSNILQLYFKAQKIYKINDCFLNFSTKEHFVRLLFGSLHVKIFFINSHNKKHKKTMNRFTLMPQKEAIPPHYKPKHCRSNSIRSHNHSNGKKVSAAAKMYQKILTQTTTSKNKRHSQLTPKRSCSTSKKNKADKALNDSRTLKNSSKGPKGKDKLFMAQSLNIPNLDLFGNEEYMRNSSQQLSTNHMDGSIFMNGSLSEILSRTHKVFQHYEKTCKSLQRHQKEVERELMQAKTQILQLQTKLSKSKNKNL